jgi:flagellar hook-associated protein 3 FlgL
MRISTNTFIEGSVGRLTDLQSKISKVQQQISSGKRLITPSDDPIAAAQVVEINNSIALNEQFAKNRLQLANNLNQTDVTLSNITDVLQNINETIVSASNGLNSAEDKLVMATTLQGQFDQLLSLANSTDSTGNYILSGNNSSSQPFVKDPNTGLWDYLGSKQNVVVNVDHNSTMSSTIVGSNLFANANAPTLTDNQGQDRGVDNIFNQLSTAIEALKNPSPTANFDASISNLASYFDLTLTQVNAVRSDVGNRLKMIDQLDSLGSSRGLQLTQSLSNLQDLDYTKAISDFTRQQTVLQAAQQTFAQASKLSLFDYLK